MKTPIYLDYQATTPMDPRALAAMQPYFMEKYGNPHSSDHRFGWEADAAVEVARAEIAQLIGAAENEIIFTSGATESNNLALKGVTHFYRAKRRHVITVVTEHKCVLETCRFLESEGFSVTYLPVQKSGLIDLELLDRSFQADTLMVSVMAVNNEIGVLQDLSAIGEACRKRGVFFHTDAAQAAGKIPLDVKALKVDLMSISGHKMYGPKGIGALYIGRNPSVRLTPLFHGGKQERGLRSGTLSPALCVGFGEACRHARIEMAENRRYVEGLGHYFLTGLQREIDDVQLNGDADARFYGNVNVTIPGVDAGLLLAELRDVAISTGSACASASAEPSYVLPAIGVSDDNRKASLRVGFGTPTTRGQVDFAVRAIAEKVNKIRAMKAFGKGRAMPVSIKE